MSDSLRDLLRHNGVLVDETERTWRTDDGRGGILPPRQAVAPGGAAAGRHGAGVSKFDEARTLCAPFGDESYGKRGHHLKLISRSTFTASSRLRCVFGCLSGTNTLARILAPFRVESVTSTRDGYAAILFPDAAAAAAALAVAHFSPTGKKISLTAARDLRLSREAAAQAAAAHAHGGYGTYGGGNVPMAGGWVAAWSAGHGRYYYTHAGRGLTQWEPPAGIASAAAPVRGLVDYSDDEDEEEEQAVAPSDHTAGEADAPVGEYFYGDVTGSVQGPFALALMLEWVRQGALPKETPACAVGAEAFSTLGELAEFNDAFQKMADAAVAPAAAPAAAVAAAPAVTPAAAAAAAAVAAFEVAAAKKKPPKASAKAAAPAAAKVAALAVTPAAAAAAAAVAAFEAAAAKEKPPKASAAAKAAAAALAAFEVAAAKAPPAAAKTPPAAAKAPPAAKGKTPKAPPAAKGKTPKAKAHEEKVAKAAVAKAAKAAEAKVVEEKAAVAKAAKAAEAKVVEEKAAAAKAKALDETKAKAAAEKAEAAAEKAAKKATEAKAAEEKAAAATAAEATAAEAKGEAKAAEEKAAAATPSKRGRPAAAEAPEAVSEQPSKRGKAAEAAEAAPVAAASAEDAAAAEKRLSRLKVAELRLECERLGLDASGVKAVLVARLVGAS